jgi:hypothetical protein
VALLSYLHKTCFDPRRIPGLHSWWDASDSASVTLDSGRVSQLADKSGNSRHLTNTTSGSTQPSYVTAGRNGLNVARFVAASNQRLQVASSTATYKFLHDGTVCWWISVNTFGTVSNPSAQYTLFSTATSSSESGVFCGYDDANFSSNNAFSLQAFRAASGTFAASTTNAGNTTFLSGYNNILTPNTLLVSECVLDVANATAAERIAFRVNGATEIKQNVRTNAQSTANATFNFTLGNGVGGATTFFSPLQGDICELMLFNQQPTAAARDLIRRYLGAKWGVTVA